MNASGQPGQLPRGADFLPPRWLRNAHVQSVLGSSPIRRLRLRRGDQVLARTTQTEILTVSGGVRLQGFLSRQQALRERRGLVVLLHGWEGSAQSNYIRSSTVSLLAAGYDVYRLNFRDHGDSHALNPEPFHSCRLDEVASAIGEVVARPGPGVRALAGFSLGGNFALRVARIAPANGIMLDYALAVCPVIDPAHGLRQLERGWLYHAYFMRKWRTSLRRKQALFPHLPVLRSTDTRLGMRDLTRMLVERFTDFGTLERYLDGYSLAGERLETLRVPTTILTAADDPVVPVADFHALRLPPCVELDIAAHGGHCAFLTGMGMRSFVEDYLLARLEAVASAAPGSANPCS